MAFTQFDNAHPKLFVELMATVERVAAAAAFVGGAEVEAFEAEFAAWCRVPAAIGVSSGTEALVLSLRALQIGRGDEVIVPANSFIATAEAVSLVGATPRFADVDPATHLITIETIEAQMTARTRCIIPVHLYGRTVDLDPIMALARRAGLAVVEDACQAHGAVYRGRRAGTVGDCGCFSFYPTKNLGGWGDGGAVVTSRPELAERVRLLRCHGERPRHHHAVVGTTARLDAVQAAVLRIKLSRLEAWNADRRQVAAELRRALAGADVTLPAETGDDEDHVFHLFVIRSRDRDGLRLHLDARGVASAVHYPLPIPCTDAYGATGGVPVAERLAGEICSLPLYPAMSRAAIQRVADAVREFAPARRADGSS